MNVELVSRKQVASYFGVTPETVKNWEKKGIVKPYCIINRHPRYHLANVIEAISKGATEGANTCN